MGKKIGVHWNFKRFLLISALVLLTAGSAVATGNVDSDFITLYPGVFSDLEKEAVVAWIAENKAIEDRGPVDLQALISGKLPEDTPGIGPVLKVTEEMVRYNNEKYDWENPVLNDAAYAKKLGYENIIAFPSFAPNDDVIMPKYPARDKLLVSDLNHNITCYRPIYPGDTIYTVINRRYFVDGTKAEGETYRHVFIYSEASLYNQKGEKVNDAIFRCTENIRVLKEGKKAIGDGGPMPAWESPAWTNRPAHTYTDADWKKIKKMWANEKRQGATPLYWEDVEIGSYTTPTVDGPIMTSVMPTEPYGMGTGGSKTLKSLVMDPDTFKTMEKDASGIYLTKDASAYTPVVPNAKKAAAGIPPELKKSEADIDTSLIHQVKESQRSVVFNFMGREFALRNIHNWMGDQGWVYNIRWSIMAPSALEAVGKSAPQSPLTERYVHRVPALEGKEVTSHPLTGDIGITTAYVENKFVKDGEFYVDLVWWVEDINGVIWQEGGATVKLPSKNAK
jgi:hypothetical protein